MCNCPSTKIGAFGGYVGDRISNLAAKKFKQWTGFGDYTIHSNSLVNVGGAGDGGPVIESRGRTIIIRNREYLGDVYTGTQVGEFYPVEYNINPGDLTTFPWLAPIALQYEQYRPRGIIFEFKTTASDSTTSASLGSVLMATEYDPTDPSYDSKKSMMNSAYSSETKMSTSQLHGIECDPSELQRNVFYVRKAGQGVSDIRDYDIGRFTVATQGGGLGANQSIGSLYVHYEFEFFKEQMTGGTLARNFVYAVYQNLTQSTAATLHNFMSSVPLIGGVDLGFRFVQGGAGPLDDVIQIPRKWAGCAFRICIDVNNDTSAYNFTSSVGGVRSFCSVITPPTVGNWNLYNSGGWFYAVTDPSTLGAHVETYILVADIVNAEYAEFHTLINGFLPASSGALGFSMKIELIPSNYFELN